MSTNSDLSPIDEATHRNLFAVAAKAAGGGFSLIEVAMGWRESKGDLVSALPVLQRLFPEKTIDDIALVGAAVWNITENGDTVRSALTACNVWDDAIIFDAVARAVASYHDVYVRKAVDDQGQLPYLGSTSTISLDVIPFGSVMADDPLSQFGSAWWESDVGVTLTEGADNYIYVRAVNAFPRTSVSGHAQARLYWTLGSLALTVDRWQNNVLLTAAGEDHVDLIPVGTSSILVGTTPFVWKKSIERFDPISLIARVTTPFHPNPLPNQNNIRTALDWSCYRPAFSCRNVRNIVPGSPYWNKLTFHFRNHDPAPCRFMFSVVANKLVGMGVALFDELKQYTPDHLIGSIEQNARGYNALGARVDNERTVFAAACELPAHYDSNVVLEIQELKGAPPLVFGSSVELRFYALLTREHSAYYYTAAADMLGLGDSLPMRGNEQAAMIGSYLLRYVEGAAASGQ